MPISKVGTLCSVIPTESIVRAISRVIRERAFLATSFNHNNAKLRMSKAMHHSGFNIYQYKFF